MLKIQHLTPSLFSEQPALQQRFPYLLQNQLPS